MLIISELSAGNIFYPFYKCSISKNTFYFANIFIKRSQIALEILINVKGKMQMDLKADKA